MMRADLQIAHGAYGVGIGLVTLRQAVGRQVSHPQGPCPSSSSYKTGPKASAPSSVQGISRRDWASTLRCWIPGRSGGGTMVKV